MHRTLQALVMALAVLALVSGVRAADLELYVKNRPFAGGTLTQGGQLHAELGGVLQALGYSWRLSGARVDISRTAGGGPALAAGGLQLFLDGKPLAVSTVEAQGKAFVSLPALAQAMGLYYRTTPAMGTADLSIPMARIEAPPAPPASPSATPSEAAPAGETPAADAGTAAADKPLGMIKTDGTNRKSPIQVLNTDFMDTTTAGAAFVGEVRTSTSIRNTSDKPLQKVTLHLRLLNLNNDVVQEWTMDIGTMKPGATVNFTPEPPVWYNYNKIQVHPEVIVEHQELPDPKATPSPAPGGGAPPAGDGGK